MILRDSTFSWQAQHFTQMEWKNHKTRWYEAVSTGRNFPFLKEVSQNCFIFDVVISKIEEVSQNCFIFDVVISKIEEVSQNCFVLDVVKFKKRRSLAELFRF